MEYPTSYSERDNPVLKRRRTFIACNRCKVRKRKCDGHTVCRNCSNANKECVYEGTVSQKSLLEYERYIETLQLKLEQTVHKLEVAEQKYLQLEKQVNSQAPTILNSALLSLITQPVDPVEYIGPGAFISMVKALKKKILGKQLENETFHKKVDFSFLQIPEKLPENSVILEKGFIESYFSLSRSRYYFVDRYEFDTSILGKDPYDRSDWESFVYYAVVANGCKCQELREIKVFPPPSVYFSQCISYLSRAKLRPIQQIQACLLMALYVGRTHDVTFNIKAWDLSGMAIRKIVQMGLHRRQPISIDNAVPYEFCKRLFWSAYNFDRLLSLSMGKPFSIPDYAIDIPLPLSIEDSDPSTLHFKDNLCKLQKEQERNPDMKQPISLIGTLVETSKMRRIEGEIFNYFYSGRRDGAHSIIFEGLLNSLETWVSNLPPRAKVEEVLKGEECYEYFLLLYHRARLMLLLPKLTSDSFPGLPRNQALTECRLAAGGICRAYKVLFKGSILGFSSYALNTIFLAGVTLLYYLWNQGDSAMSNIQQDIRACSSLLLVFAERLPEAKSNSELFDNLADTVENGNNNGGSKSGNGASSIEQGYKSNTSNISQHSLDNTSLNFTFDDDFWDQIKEDMITQMTTHR
ncbi:predicted protein [Scheffersomyces stipitis CBS 6054]|uniref:Zn(2)-C6 fungal-type domain-containing protein n=1 Tax=Scheffersomyces stipitis (strain ATCC 58785 / CBS 6054 / NBRC 10063 / NRRL Y-11545) TaxID=322104 RepID=A3LRG8_PICST|nr:predicted protein [Scheffersomyces stipitis CBS 6054]ABN65734.2 predicted protein [Scheffersomyces stipitis CBS 6054]KAG2733905.1 hypothetical protein G9P44_003430 [Scheffersomyces stipitis]